MKCMFWEALQGKYFEMKMATADKRRLRLADPPTSKISSTWNKYSDLTAYCVTWNSRRIIMILLYKEGLAA
jgi:hypothetical protein